MRIGRKVGKNSYLSAGKSGTYFSTKIAGWTVSHFNPSRKKSATEPKKTNKVSSNPNVGYGWDSSEKISVAAKNFRKIPGIDPDWVDVIALVLFYPLMVMGWLLFGFLWGLGLAWFLFSLAVYFYSPQENGRWTYLLPLMVFVDVGLFVWSVVSGLIITILMFA
jgi:hypothetical protein